MILGDQPAIRVNLRRTLATLPGVTRVRWFSSGEEFFATWEGHDIDVALIALGLPGMGCTATIDRLVRNHPEMVVLALAGPRDSEFVRRAFLVGAHGYLAKDSSRAELLGAFAHVAANNEFRRHGSLNPGTAENGAEERDQVPRSRPSGEKAENAEPISLSRRELQVLMGISAGASNREISEKLELSNDTVKSHTVRIFRKLQARDRAHATAIAYRRGIIR